MNLLIHALYFPEREEQKRREEEEYQEKMRKLEEIEEQKRVREAEIERKRQEEMERIREWVIGANLWSLVTLVWLNLCLYKHLFTFLYHFSQLRWCR